MTHTNFLVEYSHTIDVHRIWIGDAIDVVIGVVRCGRQRTRGKIQTTEIAQLSSIGEGVEHILEHDFHGRPPLLIERTVFAQIEEEVDVRRLATVIPGHRRNVGTSWKLSGLGTSVELALDGEFVAIDLGNENIFVSIPTLFTVRLLLYN